MKQKLQIALLGILALSAPITHAAPGDDEKHGQYLKQFSSSKKSKQMILESFKSLQGCPSGSCDNLFRTTICEQIAAVDIQTGYQISGEMSGVERKFKLNQSDEALFKKLFSSCRPSSYQFWQFDSLLHVIYTGSGTSEINLLKKSLK